MAVTNIIGAGVGFSPGTVAWIVTRGLGDFSGAASTATSVSEFRRTDATESVYTAPTHDTSAVLGRASSSESEYTRT